MHANVRSAIKCPTESIIFTSENTLCKTVNVSKKRCFKDFSWKEYK